MCCVQHFPGNEPGTFGPKCMGFLSDSESAAQAGLNALEKKYPGLYNLKCFDHALQNMLKVKGSPLWATSAQVACAYVFSIVSYKTHCGTAPMSF